MSAFEHISKNFTLVVYEEEEEAAFFLPISTDFFLCVYAIFFIFAVVFFMSSLHGTLLVAAGDGYVAEQVFQQRTKNESSEMEKLLLMEFVSVEREPLKVGPSWKSSGEFSVGREVSSREAFSR